MLADLKPGGTNACIVLQHRGTIKKKVFKKSHYDLGGRGEGTPWGAAAPQIPR
jgi:hypothetical protein